MRSPLNPLLRAVTGNVATSAADDSAWAVWRVHPHPYRFEGPRQAEELWAASRELFAALPSPGEFRFWSVAERLDIDDLVERMTNPEGGDPRPWVELVERIRADYLEGRRMYRRSFWLAVKLPDLPRAQAARSAIDGVLSNILARGGLKPVPMAGADIERRAEQATAIEARFPQGLTFERATPADITWLYWRAFHRGLDIEVGRHEWHHSVVPRSEGGWRMIGDGVVTERLRTVEVDTEAGVSHQAFIAIADLPPQGGYPSGPAEWWARMQLAIVRDSLEPVPVDWHCYVRSVPNDRARKVAKRRSRRVASGFGEVQGDRARTHPQLYAAAEAIDQHELRLAARDEPELQFTCWASVAHHDPKVLERYVAAVRNVLPSGYGYAMGRPVGGQEQLWLASLPASPPQAVWKAYRQWSTPVDLACSAPFAAAEVGHPHGMMIGLNLTEMATPVLVDPTYPPVAPIGAVRRHSPSMILSGPPGVGKSVLAKIFAHGVAVRGGQVIVIDQDYGREYARLAEALDVPTLVLDPKGAEWSMDPLRVFPGPTGRLVFKEFLCSICGVGEQDPKAHAIGAAIMDATSANDALHRLYNASQHSPTASEAYLAVMSVHDLGLASAVFDPSLPVPDIAGADYIVFSLPGLKMPTKEQIESGRLQAQQMAGPALLYLAVALARDTAYANSTRFSLVIFDEAWAVTANPFGRSLLEEGFRVGRKHNTAFLVSSQNPADADRSLEGHQRDDHALSATAGLRFVFRHEAKHVPAAARLLGCADDEEVPADISELLTQLRVGQCLVSDNNERIGYLQIILPPDPRFLAAINTRPDRDVETAA